MKRLINMLPSHVLFIKGVKYLTRFYVLLKDWRFFNVFIHHIHASDQDDGWLHSHPFWFSLAFVFKGGYKETLRVGDKTVTRILKPLSFNFITRTTFHSVELLDEKNGSWSIFIAGPRKTSYPEWQFWDPRTGKVKYFKENPDAIP